MDPDTTNRRVDGLVRSLLMLVRTTVRPEKSLHLRWYDRVIRGIGALILLAALVSIFYTVARHGT
jgi:hypothetical protein